MRLASSQLAGPSASANKQNKTSHMYVSLRGAKSSWEAKSSSVYQEILHLLWKQDVHNYVHKNVNTASVSELDELSPHPVTQR